MNTSVPRLVIAIGTFLLTMPVVAQNVSIEKELDVYWAEMARTLNEGDHEGMIRLYHPDAIWEGGEGDSLRISLEKEPLLAFKPFLDEIKAGVRHAKIEFRFSARIHDENSAHEIGMIHSVSGETRGESEHGYFKLDAYLVKKNGSWMMLIEDQTNQVLSEADWNALKDRH